MRDALRLLRMPALVLSAAATSEADKKILGKKRRMGSARAVVRAALACGPVVLWSERDRRTALHARVRSASSSRSQRMG